MQLLENSTVVNQNGVPKQDWTIQKNKRQDNNIQQTKTQALGANLSTPTSLGNYFFAESLEGTEIDGQLRTDDDGNLIIDLAARDFFDYFLNTAGEVGFDQATGVLTDLIHQSLEDHAAEQALTLLNEYIEYKSAVTLLSAQPLLQANTQSPEYYLYTLETTFNELKLLRRDLMSEHAVKAFFSLEEAYGQFTLDTMRINMDENLDAQAKEQLIEYRRSFLPSTIRNTEYRVAKDVNTSNTVLAAVNSQASDEAVAQTLTEQSYSREHIDSVIAFRQQQRDFNSKYLAYTQERDQLLEQGATQQEVIDLRKRFFSVGRELTQARLQDLN